MRRTATLLALVVATAAEPLVTDPYAADWSHRKPAPTPATSLFATAFGNDMVLQQQPAKAAVYGTLPNGTKAVSIKVEGSGSSYTVDATVTGSTWKALLHPAQAVLGGVTITATAGSSTATLERVSFGDVWYCGGQSNMALPLLHTNSRNISVDAIKAGKYANMRIHGMQSNMNTAQPWTTLKDAVAADFFGYSSTCYYFGESLVDELGSKAPPIGLIHTSYGGSTIEQWLDTATQATCKQTGDPSGEWHEARVMPYIDTTLKGWVWYQGENDMHGTHGNSKLGYGYGCMMPALVKSWRKLWSSVEGTTEPDAPFGIVTLAESGSEGGASMGDMQWAQTANYGVTPNPALPKVFLAQAFDLSDPFGNITCYKSGCCAGSKPSGPADKCASCFGPGHYCENLTATNFYMGPIHPRFKKPVGERLAKAGAVIAYGKEGIYTGPTLAGCSMSGSKITVTFNSTLLGSDKVLVQDYSKANNMSALQVLTDSKLFCVQTSGKEKDGGSECLDDGTGKDLGKGAFEDQGTWVTVDIDVAGTNSITVDLAKSGGKAFGIRYGWDNNCCDPLVAKTGAPCPLANCPLFAETARLPANPFLAKIVDGKCECIAPQVCGGATSVTTQLII